MLFDSSCSMTRYFDWSTHDNGRAASILSGSDVVQPSTESVTHPGVVKNFLSEYSWSRTDAMIASTISALEGRGTVDADTLDALEESFLGVLSLSSRRELAASARVVELPAGKLVYDPQLSIIVAGTLRAFVADGNARHLTVSYLRRPDAVGISGAAGGEFPLAFQSVTASTILRFPQARFDEILQTHAEVGWSAARELAHFVDDVLAEIARVAFQPVRARIAHHLLALTDCEGCEHYAVHQTELAAAVGSVREVVGRTVGTLRDAGLVDGSLAGITPVNKEGLRRVAGQRE